jgi:hypothetical protein
MLGEPERDIEELMLPSAALYRGGSDRHNVGMSRGSYTYRDLIRDTLRAVGKPLTGEEIWRYASDRGYAGKVRSVGKTPWATIVAQIYVSIANDPQTPFMKVGRRPVRFFLTELASSISAEDLRKQALRPEESTQTRLRERDVHPLLVYFAYSQLGVHCKTIQHERSSKTSKSEWLHPDVVGPYMPVDNWETVTLELSREIGAPVARLYAFELKLEVNFGNLRESFFQAVSNASWANEGYLAALRFSADPEFEAELKRLSDAFGIGIIRLDAEDPDASEIVYRSRNRAELDWETINKLASLNPDFADFTRAVRDALKIHRISPADFDGVPSDADELVAVLISRHRSS